MSTGAQGSLDFGDLVVVVTGAGRGLGRRYALDLAARGARVVVCARHGETASAVVAEARAAGGDAVACVADARDGQAPVTTALEAFGRVDGMIVNAGQTRDRSFGRMTDEEWSDVLGVHLDGARAVTAAAWSAMRAQGAGRILLTGSGAGFFGNRGQANYAAAKAGVVGLGLTLAAEGAPYGIGANVVAPMAMTDMTENVLDDAQGEVLTAERVSPVVLALVHPSCPVSGQVLEAGGGWVGALRWERSEGVRVAGERPAPEDFAGSWEKILHFGADSVRPTCIADSVEAGMGA
ncbi:SDR family NAD(P)-dependent oxidoreductase [Actinomycetospora endophytica]|uniref:SDR family NAD(P)-dependent oxidoreductase n=1 Tax=Actinomycetospora endophytica TaxID=2291215 RepID=A0ABS8PHN7_9PSEU|nr:SDR family NAD(P)-dependent oxidoreductase [Actinomycetospora endophytica]MCD2197742.1 SDR family NAD(P)-dependent oxidoreductase [Actinomycetospora endophytica]